MCLRLSLLNLRQYLILPNTMDPAEESSRSMQTREIRSIESYVQFISALVVEVSYCPNCRRMRGKP